MKKLALFLTLATGMVAQDGGIAWSRRVDNGSNGSLAIGGSISYSVTTYYAIIDHKLLYSIRKINSEEFYELFGADDRLISKWDDLAAAKKEAQRLSATFSNYPCFGSNAIATPISTTKW